MLQLGETSLLGKTYEDILEDATGFRKEMKLKEEEEKKLAEEAKIEEAERIGRLGKALTVSAYNKGFSEVEYQEYITVKFAFENNSEKDIRAFTGILVFNDLFD